MINSQGRKNGATFVAPCQAPRVGLEPTAYRLTAGRSTIELSGKAFRLLRRIVYHEVWVNANLNCARTVCLLRSCNFAQTCYAYRSF
jgi:hypothetical protein